MFATISKSLSDANSVEGFGLDPTFAQTLSALLASCRAAGLDFRISQGLRTPQKQAEYYCRWAQRPPAKIDSVAKQMEKNGAPWLASVLRAYRDIPRQSAWLTSQLPGSGWHQWGVAADCYCFRNGKMVENGSDPAYRFYADQAIKLGLTAGYYFGNQDSGHVQGPSANGATSVYTWSYIDSVMKERFADKDHVALNSAVPVAAVSFATVTPFAGFAPSVLTSLAAAASNHYKDDPTLVNARLEPESVYDLPSKDGTLRRMAQTYNAIGGLVDTFAKRLDIDPVAVLAVWYVESGGRSFTPGKPVLRLENHKFFKFWGVDHEPLFDKHFQFGGHAGVPGASHKNHKFRNKATDAWRSVHVDSQDREYEAFALAEKLGGREAASLSSSFGGPQIMGFNHRSCGYLSANAMADAFGLDQRWQVLGFYDFCKTNNLIDEVKNKQWIPFGQKYNGNGAVYGPKLKAAYDTKKALLALPKKPNPPFVAIFSALAAGKKNGSAKPKLLKSKTPKIKPGNGAKVVPR